MIEKIRAILSIIGFALLLTYIVYLDCKVDKLKSENSELRYKIQTKELR